MKIIKESKLTEGRGHSPSAWLINAIERYDIQEDFEEVNNFIEEDIAEVMSQLKNFEEIETNEVDFGSYGTRDGLVLTFDGADDFIEIELNPVDFGDFLDEVTYDQGVLDIVKSLPSANEIIEKEKAKDPEIEDEEIFEWLDSEDFSKLSNEFDTMMKEKITKWRPRIQTALRNIFGKDLLVATSSWTSKPVEEELELNLNEEKSNDEIAKIFSKIADLEAELDILMNDKETDEKEIKSVKSKIYNLNKKLNEGKENTDARNLSNIKLVLQASGIKTPNTLEKMSAAILKDLKTKYGSGTMDEEGIYYNPAIIDATQKLIEFITGKKPEIEFGPVVDECLKKQSVKSEGRVKELLFANKNLDEALSISKLESELPKYLKATVDNNTEYLEISYMDSPEKPEDFDEGYITGWEKGKDPAFDKEQEERFREATEAYEAGEVYQVRNVSDDTIIAVLYGDKEADEFLKTSNAEEVDIENLIKGM